MIKCTVAWIPKNNEALASLLDSIAPYMDASYDDNQKQLHGEMAFDLALWLQMWDTQAGFFVTAHDGDTLVGVAMCVKYRPLWYNLVRVDIDRITANTTDIAKTIEEYIVGIADVLGVNEIYRVEYSGTREVKERLYGSIRKG